MHAYAPLPPRDPQPRPQGQGPSRRVRRFRRFARARAGATLIDLATALALLAVGLAVALPPAGTLRDRLAVGAARGEVEALLLRARAEAPGFGGSRIEVVRPDDEVRLVAGDSVRARYRPGREHGVALEIGGERERAEIVYDALGLGRIASRTLVFTRGRARDTLRVSSYGRVSR